MIARVEHGSLMPDPDFPGLVFGKAASKAELRTFVGELLGRLEGKGRIVGAAIALAGPVSHRREVTMTNWLEPRDIRLEEFVEWGFPAGRTVLVNDMEAGCYGLVKHLEEDKTASSAFERLTVDGDVSSQDVSNQEIATRGMPHGNRVFIAPGTGLGAAGIIEGERIGGVYPIAVELQHTPMPILNQSQGIVVNWLRDQKRIMHPSWDDIISGRGLVHTYRALRSAVSASMTLAKDSDVTVGVADPAAAVAKAGVRGEDVVAEQALSVFYTCAGYFCQLMALGFQAFGGVFIGGKSTIKNREFITKSALLEAFLDNAPQRSLLARFPVYLVKEEDLNPDGALWLGFDVSKE